MYYCGQGWLIGAGGLGDDGKYERDERCYWEIGVVGTVDDALHLEKTGKMPYFGTFEGMWVFWAGLSNWSSVVKR